MGQYWKAVNLTKKEYVNPHPLGSGSKLGEMLGTHMGSALIILTAAMPERRGGGDFDLDSNYYGPERTTQSGSAEVVPEYNEVAKRTIGRWAGDKIAFVGDYAEDSDLPEEFEASSIYNLCYDAADEHWLDVTPDVAKVIEHECDGQFTGTGWREFVSNRV